MLSHWRQSDPSGWRPQRGDDFSGSLSQVQRQVELLVDEAESEWARDASIIRLEFVLPKELLNLSVDQWLWEANSGSPQPLGLRYEVVVRSWERMCARTWHRQWRRRWRMLQQRISDGGFEARDVIYWARPVRPRHLRGLDARLATSDQAVSLVLGQPPTVALNGADELMVVLRGISSGGVAPQVPADELLRGSRP